MERIKFFVEWRVNAGDIWHRYRLSYDMFTEGEARQLICDEQKNNIGSYAYRIIKQELKETIIEG